MADKHTYIFAGGGTGGHLYPAIAIAQHIQALRPESDIHFVGTTRGLENRVIPELGYPLHRISVRGVARRASLKNLLVPFVLLWSVVQCVSLLMANKPKVVIGTGGYVSGPVLFAATMLGFPTLIQEQNSYPGATTRILSQFVKRVHISFAESIKFFKKKDKLFLTGNPVRDFDLAKSKAKARKLCGLKEGGLVLFVFGGSQGARAINKIVLESMKELMDGSDLQILWSTGTFDIEDVKSSVENYSDRIRVSEYISDMEAAYGAADFVLARAGALTLAELTLAGLPSILVPLPSAAANHQETNARALAANGAAVILLQKELTPTALTRAIFELVENKQKREQMALASKNTSFPNATHDIVQSIFDIEK